MRPGGVPIEDSADAFRQIRDSWFLLAMLLSNALSIAFFNGANLPAISARGAPRPRPRPAPRSREQP